MEWCSMTVVTILSPLSHPMELATMLIASVVFLTITTFSRPRAPMKWATSSWAASYSSLALWENLCTPLSTFALYSL